MKPNPELGQAIKALPGRRFIFTSGDRAISGAPRGSLACSFGEDIVAAFESNRTMDADGAVQSMVTLERLAGQVRRTLRMDTSRGAG